MSAWVLIITLLGVTYREAVAVAAVPMATQAACEAAKALYQPQRNFYTLCVPTGAQ